MGLRADKYLEGLNEYSTFRSKVFMETNDIIDLNLRNIGVGDLLKHGNNFEYLEK